MRSAEHAERVAGCIVESLARKFDVAANSLSISASVGLALYPVHGMDAQSLIKQADRAVYQAKAGHDKLAAGGRSAA